MQQSSWKYTICDHKRRGYTLVMVALCLTSLMGVLGLVTDAGLLFVAHRASQNAADAAARACAKALHSGAASGTLQGIAETFAFTHNGIPEDSDTPVVVNHPPASGPYAGNADYVEVFVSHPLETTFIQAVGVAQHQSVRARAVAGYKSREIDAGLVILNPRGNPGLSVGGSPAILDVNSGVVVYTRRSGQDEYGNTVGQYNSGSASVSMSGSPTLTADAMYVSGGVDSYFNYTAPNVGELHAGTDDPVYDPFHDASPQLPIPTTGNGVINRNLGSVSVTNNKATGLVAPNSRNAKTGITTLYPGIYRGINVTGGTVELMPGIYVLRPTSGGNVLSVNGGTVSGSSVMFYNTGSTYNAVTGEPSADGDLTALSETDPPSLNGTRFGGVDIHGQSVVTLSGIDASNSAFSGINIAPFNGMLFYQRRFNQQPISITDGSAGALQGTMYAKWANLHLSGSGHYDFAVVAGSVSIDGGANVNIHSAGFTLRPKIQPVRLVE